jgi:hypothetical protein
MVAVAIVAFLIYGELTRRRWATLSAGYRSKAELARVIQAWYMGIPEGPMKGGLQRGQLEDIRRSAVRQGEIADRYERAARYPWLPVAPDPPEPDVSKPDDANRMHPAIQTDAFDRFLPGQSK